MNAEMIAALRELEREKGIAFETILQGLEEAMASAYKTWWKQENPTADDEFAGFRAVIDPESGAMRIWHQELDEVEAEDGETLVMEVRSEAEVEVTDEFLGRIGAQTAKQVIFQKLRDAEREMTYEEFAGREGDVVTGIVQQQERRYTLLDLGKVEALLPQAEQVPSEPYRHGERLKAYITEVRKGTKGPQIVVSRSHPGLLKALFALEVPEIEEGIVEIKAVSREPGHRSKIAVSSNEPGVDPVGACVGPKGSRVRMVVNELRGEKIDVVPWSADPGELVANALQPAKVKEVRIDPDTQTALVVVPDYQLSLAIGKEGQNARLAARLTGWRIDIKSESQAGGEPVPPRPASAAAAPETIAVAQTAAVPEAVAVSETIAVPETDATEEVVIAQEEAETATEAIDELALEEVAVAAIDEAVAEESEAPVGE
ncbi:MAG: transcription termination/antitermination protein NusA [Actinomycetota bacterium]|nr:transcription termination/antitermination protein NusA [Actinomycetota bacterium]